MIGSRNLKAGPMPWANALIGGGGRIGVWYTGIDFLNTGIDARFDDFGGGSIP
jgi:hypothetical protein